MTISQKSILDEVAKATAYLGAKRDQYERLSTVDANDEILSRYWRQAVASAAIALGPAAEVAITDAPTPTASFAIASDIDSALAESMIRAYLIEHVVAQWLALADIAHPQPSLDQLASLAGSARSGTRPLSPF